jgi:hypothetical protein
MFHKAAAARSLNSKIMQKRAAFANRPSDAYLAGFCKAAEEVGVNPLELMKIAGIGNWFIGGLNKLKNFGSNLAQGISAPIRGIQAVGAGLGNMVRGGSFMNGMKSSWNNGVNKINNMFGVNGGIRAPAINPARGVASGVGAMKARAPMSAPSPAPAAPAPATPAPATPAPAAAAPAPGPQMAGAPMQ